MGARQSKPVDMFVLLIRGDVEVCALGIFSTLEEAKQYAEDIGDKRSRWIEKFRIDDPGAYEDEYVVWKS
jgi:hypothetical protein